MAHHTVHQPTSQVWSLSYLKNVEMTNEERERIYRKQSMKPAAMPITITGLDKSQNLSLPFGQPALSSTRLKLFWTGPISVKGQQAKTGTCCGGKDVFYDIAHLWQNMATLLHATRTEENVSEDFQKQYLLSGTQNWPPPQMLCAWQNEYAFWETWSCQQNWCYNVSLLCRPLRITNDNNDDDNNNLMLIVRPIDGDDDDRSQTVMSLEGVGSRSEVSEWLSVAGHTVPTNLTCPLFGRAPDTFTAHLHPTVMALAACSSSSSFSFSFCSSSALTSLNCPSLLRILNALTESNEMITVM